MQEKWIQHNPWVKIRQEEYLYLSSSQTIFRTKGDCIEESFYKCAVTQVINNNFQGKGWDKEWNCTKNCFPSILLSLASNDTTYECENYEQELCSFNSFEVYEVNCPKSCSIIQYLGRIDLWDYDGSNPNYSSFVVYLRFSPPLTSTLYEEYVIYDVYGMIGSVGGTLGIFIGFSCSSVLSLFTNLLKKQNFQNLKMKFFEVYQFFAAKLVH